MEQAQSVSMYLLSIEETKIINNIGGKDLANMTENNLNIHFRIHSEVYKEKDEIHVNCAIKYTYENQELFLAESKNKFHVDDLSNLIIKNDNDNTVGFKYDIIPTLINISYGTLRGIVYKETKNSPLEKYPVPLIPLNVLTEKSSLSIVE